MRMRILIPTIVTILSLFSALATAAEPCQSNAQCPQSSYCAKYPGDCYGAGTCTPKPQNCMPYYDPVCGCDGQIYSNQCYAAAAGVSVNYSGECTHTQPCGGFGGIPCPAGQYCKLDGCYPDAGGYCEPIPLGCPDVWDPVCGCDDETYGNSCEAAMAQMTVDYEGECSTTVPCTENAQCPSTSYCAKVEGDCDGTGQCQAKPIACPEIYDPVCGCDGNTYSNSCEAAAAGVNVDYDGQCVKVCGTITGIPCDTGEYCNLDGCYPDAGGLCEPIPTDCPDVWDPVCGCDGVTYGNSCEAAMAQMTVDYEGECSTTFPCTNNTQCPSTSYCAKVEGDCGGTGQCQEKPLACPKIYDPVCGCDGQTYSNNCYAAAAGVNVDYDGVCLPGPTILMLDPNVAPDDVHTGPSGLEVLRILWSEPVIFDLADITIVNEHGMPVLFAIEGNNTEIMTITFDSKLIYDSYTIIIADSVLGAVSGIRIDGDNNGLGRGDAVIVMEHRMRTDADNNNLVNFRDLSLWADTWLAELD